MYVMKKLNLTVLLLGSAYIAADSAPRRIDVAVYTDQKFNEMVEQARVKVWNNVHKDYEVRFKIIPFDTFSNIVNQRLSSQAVTEALRSLHSDAKQPNTAPGSNGDRIVTSHQQINEILQQIGQQTYQKLQETKELYQAQMKHDAQERAKTQSGWWIMRWWHGR
jgi:hypothetical protein